MLPGRRAGRTDGLLADPVFGSGNGMLGPLATSLSHSPHDAARMGVSAAAEVQNGGDGLADNRQATSQSWDSSSSAHFSASICISPGGQGQPSKRGWAAVEEVRQPRTLPRTARRCKLRLGQLGQLGSPGKVLETGPEQGWPRDEALAREASSASSGHAER